MVIETLAVLAILFDFAYALARVSGQPLLFNGDDFSKSDLAVAA